MRISLKKKRLLIEFQDYICESCHNKFEFEELEIHRIKRDWQNGTYKDHRNLKILCKKCHKLYHSMEVF